MKQVIEHVTLPKYKIFIWKAFNGARVRQIFLFLHSQIKSKSIIGTNNKNLLDISKYKKQTNKGPKRYPW